jgi:prevent-host-death family protein
MSDKQTSASVIGLRELSRETRAVIERIESTGAPAIVTKQGKPVAALIAVDGDRLRDLVLSAAPEFVDSTREADEALASGATHPMSEVLSEMQTGTTGPSSVVEPDPQHELADYQQQLQAWSVEALRYALPEETSSDAIEEFGNLSFLYFKGLVRDAYERTRVVSANALRVGTDQGGGFDTSLKLLQGAAITESLSGYPPSDSPFAAYAGKWNWSEELSYTDISESRPKRTRRPSTKARKKAGRGQRRT